MLVSTSRDASRIRCDPHNLVCNVMWWRGGFLNLLHAGFLAGLELLVGDCAIWQAVLDAGIVKPLLLNLHTLCNIQNFESYTFRMQFVQEWVALCWGGTNYNGWMDGKVFFEEAHFWQMRSKVWNINWFRDAVQWFGLVSDCGLWSETFSRNCLMDPSLSTSSQYWPSFMESLSIK